MLNTKDKKFQFLCRSLKHGQKATCTNKSENNVGFDSIASFPVLRLIHPVKSNVLQTQILVRNLMNFLRTQKPRMKKLYIISAYQKMVMKNGYKRAGPFGLDGFLSGHAII